MHPGDQQVERKGRKSPSTGGYMLPEDVAQQADPRKYVRFATALRGRILEENVASW
jgi:hypothetical protein